MPTNFYFQSGSGQGTTNEQRLVEDLIIESLKIYGHDTYYLPRTLVNKDTIFDEDECTRAIRDQKWSKMGAKMAPKWLPKRIKK